MRKEHHWRELAVSITAVCVTACGSTNPAAPSSSDVIATGPQVFRAVLQSRCAQSSGDFLPMIYTRVIISRAGSEWVATASSAPSGDLELRFHQSSTRAVGNSMEVEGTVKGTGIHMPELVQAPPWNARASFGTDGGASLRGIAFPAGYFGSQTAGVDGIGSGSIAIDDSSGHSCSGDAFTWSLFPPQNP